LLDVVAFAPLAIPGIVVGLALIWVYLTLPIPIYGTLWILVLAFVTKYTSYAVRSTHASLSQLHQELEEASAVSGASWLRTSSRIVFPLIAGGVLVSFIYILSLTFKVLSLPVLLAAGGTKTLPVVIFDLYFDGRYPELNALGVMMFAVLVVLSWLAWRLSSRSTLIAYEP
jgi:iron(III) transport system permease protein